MKTKTGALPNSAGFPGKNMVIPRLHHSITHISFTGQLDADQILIINKMAEIAYYSIKKNKV